MRTLFLMGILAVLVIIAVKKPNQTVWDAARHIKQQAEMAVAETTPGIVESSPPSTDGGTWKEVEDLVNQVVKSDKTKLPTPTSTPTPDEGSGSEGRDGVAPNIKRQPTDVADADLWTDSYLDSNEDKSVASTPPIPDLPAISEPPIQVDRLRETTVPEAPSVKVAQRKSYENVKVYYERANQLLNEIK